MTEEKKGEKGLVQFNFAQVLARKHGGLILNPFEAKIILSERKGHLYYIQGKHAISGAGYIHLNRIASVNLVTPQNVVVDGVSVPNPHIERAKITKAIEAVNIRKIAIGFSPVGNIVAIDKTLFYNVYTYFIQAIQAKMKRKKKDSEELEYPNCAMYGTRRDKPDLDGKWVFYETARPIGIWADYSHPAIVACLEDHTQRQRFGDRIAQKIVERNCLKDHPAIGISQVEVKNGQTEIRVYGWRHELEKSNIDDIAAKVEKGDASIKTEEDIIDVKAEEEEEVVEEAREEAAEDEPEKPGRSPAEMEEPE